MILASFTLTAPLVLLAALAAALPIVLHLLGRATAQTFEFPTFRFVRQATAKTARRRRVENVLLLTFRVGIFTLLPLAIALPLHRSNTITFGSGRDLSLAIILDNTASMNQRVGSQTAFDLARRQAIRLLRGSNALAAPQTAIFLCPVGLAPVVSSNLTQLAEQIRTVEPAGAEADLSQTLRRAQDLLDERSEPNKLIYLLTDRQASSLPADAAQNLKCPVAILGFHESEYNLSISDVHFSNPIITGKPFSATVQISGRLAASRNFKLKMTGDSGQVLARRDLLYTASPLEPIRFNLTIPKPGAFAGTIELELDDQLPLDNRWFYTAIAQPPIRILLSSDNVSAFPWSQDPAFFICAALNAPGWIDIKSMSNDLNTANAIFIPDAGQIDAKLIKTFLEKPNKRAVMFLPPSKTCSLVNELGLGKIEAVRSADPPAAVEQVDAVDPLLSDLGFKTSVYRQIAVSRYVKVRPADGIEVLLTLTGNDPLLLKCRFDTSALYAFTVPPLISAGTLPVNPIFPALLAQVAAETVSPVSTPMYRAGKPFAFTADHRGTLLGPTSQPVTNLAAGANQISAFFPGLYNFKDNATARTVLAVNVDETASDLSIQRGVKTAETGQNAIFVADDPEVLESNLNTLARGRPLWDYILVTVLAVLLAETLLENFRPPATDSP